MSHIKEQKYGINDINDTKLVDLIKQISSDLALVSRIIHPVFIGRVIFRSCLSWGQIISRSCLY